MPGYFPKAVGLAGGGVGAGVAQKWAGREWLEESRRGTVRMAVRALSPRWYNTELLLVVSQH